MRFACHWYSIGETHKFIDDGENGYLYDTLEEVRQAIVNFKDMSSKQYNTFIKSAIRSTKAFEIAKFAEILYKEIQAITLADHGISTRLS